MPLHGGKNPFAVNWAQPSDDGAPVKVARPVVKPDPAADAQLDLKALLADPTGRPRSLLGDDDLAPATAPDLANVHVLGLDPKEVRRGQTGLMVTPRGRQQIREACAKTLRNLAGYNPRRFNFYRHNARDYFDTPVSGARAKLTEVRSALAFGASSSELKGLSGLFRQIDSQLAMLATQDNPQFTASTPNSRLRRVTQPVPLVVIPDHE